MISIAWR